MYFMADLPLCYFDIGLQPSSPLILPLTAPYVVHLVAKHV